MSADTSLVRPTFADETEVRAVDAGYNEFDEEVRDQLGELSLAATQMGEIETNAEIARANVEYLKGFARLLPTAAQLPQAYGDPEGRYYFAAHGQDALHTFRQIQANVLWVNEKNALQLNSNRSLNKILKPYWLIGAANDAEEGVEQVLLLPAFTTKDETDRQPVSLRVRAKDMEYRQQIADGIFEGMSEEEQKQLFNEEAREFRLPYSTDRYGEHGHPFDGNISIWDNDRGERAREKVQKDGVRVRHNWEGMSLEALPADSVNAFDAKRRTAVLASAFGILDEVERLQTNPQARSEVDVAPDKGENGEGEVSREELMGLVEAMRADMIALLTPVLGADAASKVVEEKYALPSHAPDEKP